MLSMQRIAAAPGTRPEFEVVIVGSTSLSGPFSALARFIASATSSPYKDTALLRRRGKRRKQHGAKCTHISASDEAPVARSAVVASACPLASENLGEQHVARVAVQAGHDEDAATAMGQPETARVH